MADFDSTVKTNIEVNLTKDDSGKAVQGIENVTKKAGEAKKTLAGMDDIQGTLNVARGLTYTGEKLDEVGEKTALPQRELRILAQQLGTDIPGASELMRAGFVGGAEPMLAAIFLIIGGLEILKESQKKYSAAISEGISATNASNEADINFANTLSDLTADSAEEVVKHLRHLNSEYDVLTENLTKNLATINSQAEAMERIAKATNEAAIANIKLQEAQGSIGHEEAAAMIAGKRQEAEIARQNAAIKKEEAEAQEKLNTAQSESLKAKGLESTISSIEKNQKEKDIQIAGMDKTIAKSQALGSHADLEAKAVALEATLEELLRIGEIKNTISRDLAKIGWAASNKALALQLDVPGGAGAFINEVSSARMLANASNTTGLEENKKKLERQKGDLDDQHTDAVTQHDASVAKAKAEGDEAQAILKNVAVEKETNVTVNRQTSLAETRTQLASDITEAQRIIEEHHLVPSSDPSQIIASFSQLVSKTTEERKRWNQLISDLQAQVHKLAAGSG
jgi:hypothetical protein